MTLTEPAMSAAAESTTGSEGCLRTGTGHLSFH